VVDDRWSDICRRWGEQGYDSLSRPERTWLNIRSLIDSVENGGVISYFYNSGAATVGDCLDDLRALGAEVVRVQVERVCALFPDGVPIDQSERNKVIDSWSEDEKNDSTERLLEEVDDILMPLMADVENRLGEFLARSGLATQFN
jgi:hypothetical protein